MKIRTLIYILFLFPLSGYATDNEIPQDTNPNYQHWYLQAFGGGGFVGGSDGVYDFGASVGYAFNQVSLEAQYMYLNEINLGMLNLYYDFHNSSPVTPYLGIGAGWGELDFVAQGAVGFKYAINDKFDVDLGYRFVWLVDDIGANLFNLGFSFRF